MDVKKLSTVVAVVALVGAAMPQSARAGCRTIGSAGSNPLNPFFDPATPDFYYLNVPNVPSFLGGGGLLSQNAQTLQIELVIMNPMQNAGASPNVNGFIGVDHVFQNLQWSGPVFCADLQYIGGDRFPVPTLCSDSTTNHFFSLAPGQATVFLLNVAQGPDALTQIQVITQGIGQSSMTVPPQVEATISYGFVDGCDEVDVTRQHIVLDRKCMQ